MVMSLWPRFLANLVHVIFMHAKNVLARKSHNQKETNRILLDRSILLAMQIYLYPSYILVINWKILPEFQNKCFIAADRLGL